MAIINEEKLRAKIREKKGEEEKASAAYAKIGIRDLRFVRKDAFEKQQNIRREINILEDILGCLDDH